jgi:hypothetical protein
MELRDIKEAQMSLRIKDTSKVAVRIKDTGKAAERISPEEVAKALGAEPTEYRVSLPPGNPTGRAIRQELHRLLRSNGGRPALEGSERRQKIPLSDTDWARLCAAAERLHDDQAKPTPGQVAAILLRRGLDWLEQKEPTQLTEEHKAAE